LLPILLSLFVLFQATVVSGADDGGSRAKLSSSRIEKASGKSHSNPTPQPCDELIHDAAISSTVDNEFKFLQSSGYWAVVGLRPDPGSDWDLSLYSDSCGTGTENSYSWSYEDSTEFVVADYNHSPTGWEGVWIGRWSGTGDARVEYENAADALVIGSNPGLDWPTDDVVKIWDINLDPDVYTFELAITSGGADLGIAIFESNGSAYYAGRWEAVAAGDAGGGGVDESCVYNALQTDWYAVVVWSNTPDPATFDINVMRGTGIGDGKGSGMSLPAAFALNQNHPNPFNPSTVISYQLPEKANVNLKIHDIRGRVVRELVSGFRKAGSYSVQWDGKNSLGQGAPSGIYFYVLDTDRGYRSTRKMVSLK